jgi:OmpA-OmpF porin, OOP family
MFKILNCVSLLCVIFTFGCATKEYVNQQVGPIIDKVNVLDQRAASNTHAADAANDITEKNIAALDSRIAQANESATAASHVAEEATQRANGVGARANSLVNRTENVDNYQSIGEISIQFSVEGDRLDEKAIARIDEFAASIPSVGDYVLTLEGNTDAAGSPQYNYDLSKRRAQAVARYLATKLHVSPHHIFSVGLGPDKPVAENKTTSGRARNRRVLIALFTNAPATQAHEEPAQSAEIE